MIAVLLLVAYYAVGYYLKADMNDRFDRDFFAYGLAAAFFAPLLLILVLAKAGSRFWENDVGLNLVFLAVATMPENGGLAWTFLVDNGHLHSALLEWTLIGGPWWVVLCNMWRLTLIRRLRKDADNGAR